jgi:hypothetical protein
MDFISNNNNIQIKKELIVLIAIPIPSLPDEVLHVVLLIIERQIGD